MIRALIGAGFLFAAYLVSKKIYAKPSSEISVAPIQTENTNEIFVPELSPVAGIDFSVKNVSFGVAADNFLTSLGETVKNLFSLPASAEPYKEAIRQAEVLNGIPDGMLGRLLYQESHFRTDIINGKTKSPVGALGIAQFMPATSRDLGVDPLNAFASIAAAGRYLAQLYRITGTWSKALASYNWGVGNVSRKGLSAAPKETRDYVAEIMNDLGLA